jgi:hypothetical protein
VAVTDLQGVLHGLRDLTGLGLPGAEAKDGEVIPTGQFNVGNHCTEKELKTFFETFLMKVYGYKMARNMEKLGPSFQLLIRHEEY